MDAEYIKRTAHLQHDGLHVSLWYPNIDENPVKAVVVELVAVRAADGVRVSYDFERDGWKIEQASIFEWPAGDQKCDRDWQDVAFVQAWGREKNNPSPL